MSAPPVILYIDTTNKRLISSFLSSIQPFQGLTLEAGDLVPFRLNFLTQNPSSNVAGALNYSYIDPATVTPVSLAVGTIGLKPTDGTFTVTFNGNTTAALAYNISAAALSTAINLLASVISAGGVTVLGSAGGPWTITFTNTGAPGHEFVIDASELAPVSVGLTSIAIAGATGVREQEVLSLLQSPAALQTSWTPAYGAAAVSRLQAGSAGVNEIQRITVPDGTYAGTFAIGFGANTSGGIPYNATAAQVQTALQALASIGASNCSVILSSPTTWDVTFIGSLGGASQSLMTINDTGLQMPEYLEGNLDMNVQGIFNLLNGATSTAATMQIQQGTSGNINTVVQTSITVNNTLSRGTPSVPNPVDPWQTLTQVLALIADPSNLPIATTTTLGGVIVPAAGHLSIDGSGNISVAIATSSVLGVVKVPASGNLSIDGSGNITLAGTITPFITNGSGTGVTVPYSGRLGRAIVKVTALYTAFSAAAKTADLTIATLPAKTRLVGIIADATINFTGGGEATSTLKVGKTTGGAEYLAVASVFSGTPTLGLLDADLGTAMTRAAAIQGGDLPSWSAPTTVSARLTTTVNNTSSLTAGSVTFYLITESM